MMENIFKCEKERMLAGMFIIVTAGLFIIYWTNHKFGTQVSTQTRPIFNRNTSIIGKITKLPSVLIIGAKKCGTTALLTMLCLHPDIACVPGEPHYFDEHYHEGLRYYIKRMPATKRNKMIIEKSPRYFIAKDVPERVARFNQTIRLLLIVRDPITRFVSDYAHVTSTAINNPRIRIGDVSIHDLVQNSSYKNKLQLVLEPSFYGRNLQRWLRVFKSDQIHIVDGEKLVRENPSKELTKVEQFLGIRHQLFPQLFRYNVHKGFYCFQKKKKGRNQRGYKCLWEHKGRKHPAISSESVSILQKLLHNDMELFDQLTHF